MEDAVEERTLGPRDDLATTLPHARQNDVRLSRGELVASLVVLAFAGM